MYDSYQLSIDMFIGMSNFGKFKKVLGIKEIYIV